jgi:hypothetical protein
MSYTLFWDGRTISSYTGTLPASFDLGAEVNPDTSQTALAIGSNCFISNSDLTSLTFGNDLLNIAGGAFKECALVQYAVFGTNLSTIEDFAFASNALVGIELPGTVTGVGVGAFTSNVISSIALPNSVTSIGDAVFSNNPTLSTLTLGTGITTIPAFAFDQCSIQGLELVNVTNVSTFAFNRNQLSSINLATVASLGVQAFGCNAPLSNVDIGGTLTEIPPLAFTNCVITSLVVPANITTLGSNAFTSNQISSFDMQATLASIGSGCFLGNAQLSSITIGAGINTIAPSTFTYCGIQSLDIPANVTDIQNAAFTSNQISSLVLPGTVASLGAQAFAFNANMSSLSITAGSLTTIPTEAFANCSIQSFEANGTFTGIGIRAFTSNQISSFAVDNTITTIGEGAFLGNKRLSNVTFGTQLSQNEGFSFSDCGLISLEIPANITTIGAYAFSSNFISSFVIPDTVTLLGEGCFNVNQTLSTLTIGTGLSNIPPFSFYFGGLSTLTVPFNVKSISSSAFATNALGEVFIQNGPAGITIEAGAFDFGVPLYYLGGGSVPSTPQIFIRPNALPTEIIYTVNSNADLASSINLYVTGPVGTADYSFKPDFYWYKYTVPGLTTGCNYSAFAFQYTAGGLSSLAAEYRTVQTGYNPGPVQNLTGTLNAPSTLVTLNWDFSASNGDADIKWHVIRDLTSTIKYNVPGTVQTFTAPIFNNPGTSLFSVEAVNDPGYSERVYWSTVIV